MSIYKVSGNDLTKKELVNLVNDLRESNYKLNEELDNYVNNLCDKLVKDGSKPNDNFTVSRRENKKYIPLSGYKEETIWEGVVVGYPKNVCLVDENLYKLLDCKCDKCMLEMSNLGYRKNMIIVIVKNYLRENEKLFSRKEKVEIVKGMFGILCDRRCNKFINTHSRFKKTIEKKLEELYNVDKFFMAYIYYRRIFGKRIDV